MASIEPSGCIKPPTPSTRLNVSSTLPNASHQPQTRRRVEWSRLLTGTTGATSTSDAELASSAGCDHEDPANGASKEWMREQQPRFDLGEGGRTAWYVPTERTVFPVKKDVGRESHREKRKEVVVVQERVEEDVLWGTTEKEVERAIRGEEVGRKGPRLRTHRSLEEDILGIEDEETRRLTAIAYLS